MITLIHNNACSKSNCVLNYLQEKSIPFTLRDYLAEPLSIVEITVLLQKLKVRPLDIIRQKEPVFQQLFSAAQNDDQLIQAIADHPGILERPILISGDAAVIGRPFEVAVAFVDSEK